MTTAAKQRDDRRIFSNAEKTEAALIRDGFDEIHIEVDSEERPVKVWGVRQVSMQSKPVYKVNWWAIGASLLMWLVLINIVNQMVHFAK